MHGADSSWLKENGGAQLAALCEHTIRQAHELDARGVVNTARALAELDLRGQA